MDMDLNTFAQELLKMKSYTGGEEGIANYIKGKMLEWGYDEAFIDEAGNCIGVIKGKGDFNILFDGHIDTVVAEDIDKWTFNPFSATIKDGKLYGRGASDMKGAVAAMVYAGAQVKKSGAKIPGNIYVSCTVNEEVAEGRSFENVMRIAKPNYVVIGEASEMNLKIGQRGRAEVVITARGKSAHSSNPHLGINAGEKIAKIIAGMKDIKINEDELVGKGISVLTDVITRPYPGHSVIPYEGRATYDRRLLPGETQESVLGEVRDVIDKLMKEDPELKADVHLDSETLTTYTGYSFENLKFFPGWKFAKDDAFPKGCLEAIKSAGLTPKVTHYSFCTNGSTSAGNQNVPTIGYGPGTEEQAHVVDEHITLDDLNNACKGYAEIMKYQF